MNKKRGPVSHSDEAKEKIGAASRARNSAAIALKARWANRQVICKIDGCEKEHMAKGLCNMHYIRLRKTGNVGSPKPMVNQNGEGYMNAYGYRMIGGRGEHVLMAEKALGKPIPDKAVVHHVNENKTDNRPCNLVICPDRAYHNMLHARMRAASC